MTGRNDRNLLSFDCIQESGQQSWRQELGCVDDGPIVELAGRFAFDQEPVAVAVVDRDEETRILCRGDLRQLSHDPLEGLPVGPVPMTAEVIRQQGTVTDQRMDLVWRYAAGVRCAYGKLDVVAKDGGFLGRATWLDVAAPEDRATGHRPGTNRTVP